jgi:hypothetical protein
MPSVSTLLWVILPILITALYDQFYRGGNILDPIIELVPPGLFDTLFTTTHCYASVKTLSPELAQAKCFTVSNGRFSKVFASGSSSGETPTGHVIPGLWDGHGHLIQYGESLDSVGLFLATSMIEVQRRLVQYKAEHSGVGSSGQWLRGVGWDQANFAGAWPTAVRDLSKVSERDHPVNLPVGRLGDRRKLQQLIRHA